MAISDLYWLGGLLQASDAAAASAPQQPETYEIDQWILDFAQLFRESLNIEPDRHLDLTNMGWDKLQARTPPFVNCLALLVMGTAAHTVASAAQHCIHCDRRRC